MHCGLAFSNNSIQLDVFMIVGATDNMLRSFFESFLAYFMEYFFQKCH